jgi:hypothetical protein
MSKDVQAFAQSFPEFEVSHSNRGVCLGFVPAPWVGREIFLFSPRSSSVICLLLSLRGAGIA